MSIMFPTIFALGVKGLGPNTKLGGSFIIMAIIGGAIFPPLMGLVQVTTGRMSLSFAIPLLSYLYIIFYSYRGSVPVRKEFISATTGMPGVIAQNNES
jgi:FHS family L-fucose permease-like MFS transporter